MNNHAHVLDATDCTTLQFLYYYINSIDLLPYVTGSAQPKMTQEKMNKIPVPLPPLPEQHRIVARIESLFVKLDRAKELVQSALDSFENRKASILHKAFTGELTAKWRKDNGVGMDSWVEKSISDVVIAMQNGISKRSGANGVPTIVLRLANIEKNKINLANSREIILNDEEIHRYSLEQNDVLLIRVNGSFENVGKMILIEDSSGWTFCDHLIRIKFSAEKVIPKFMIYLSQTNVYRRYVETNMVSSAGQNTISQKSMKEYSFYCPSIYEQQEINRLLGSFLENEKMSQELSSTVVNIDHMKKAILTRAFRGELGTNDPDEESAESMLAEILSE